MIGPEKKSRIISEKERKLTAFHEAGHAIVLRNVSETDKVERVSIIPAGGAGGYTAHKPHEDSYYATRSNLIAQIMIALGGRAAEELIFDEISTGASSDLQSCNSIARDMITKYGMSDKLGNLVFGNGDEVFLGKDYGHVQNYSEKLASIIDEEVKKIIDDAYDAVKEILTRQRDLLDALSALLLEKEKIEGPEFEEIFMRYVPDAKPAPGPVPSEAAAEALMQVAEEVEAETESDDSSTAQEQQADASNKDADSRDSDDEVSH
jgi:cell division protease FtsH